MASNIQLIIRQTFLMNEELPIPPSSLVSRHKRATRRVEDASSFFFFFLKRGLIPVISISAPCISPRDLS